ncbi:MAG TPA: hypothetical protein VGN07_09175 [Steroidobacteraceae bacterium]|jgi:hypothetical protein
MKPSDPNDKLIGLLDSVLHEQPLRRAPARLATRVLAEIERRERLPWWHHSFAHWPLAARALFLILCAASVKFAADASLWLTDRIEVTQFSNEVAAVGVWLKITITVASTVLHNVPSLWFYGGVVFIGALYAALFGISAAAYRTLYAQR